MEEIIKDAFKLFQSQVDDIDLHIESCPYGKGFMKKCRVSPDGYVQMALQLAYYRLHKEFPKTYEPSTHRLYHLGRTETVHPGSKWSVSWIKSMDDPTSDINTRRTFLKDAVKYQTKFRLDATVGKGCDRHLLGLLCASAELGMNRPKIFLDEAWSKPFKMSTSQTPNRIYETVGKDSLDYSLCNGGFGPTYNDGYGISYIIYGEDMINVSIASRKNSRTTSSIKLGESLTKALNDMKTLFTAVH